MCTYILSLKKKILYYFSHLLYVSTLDICRLHQVWQRTAVWKTLARGTQKKNLYIDNLCTKLSVSVRNWVNNKKDKGDKPAFEAHLTDNIEIRYFMLLWAQINIACLAMGN